MKLHLVGLSHKTAPIDIREKLNFSSDHCGEYLEKLCKSSEIQSAMVLSTCNRVEIYAHSAGNSATNLKNFIHDFHRLEGIDLDQYLYQKTGEEAVKHLFSVASSLDSAVVGEPQILGQVKDAYDVSKKFGMIDSFFEFFMQKTFSVAKKVRNETEIGNLSVSISSMAVDLSGKIFESLHGKSALVLGAGEMAELALFHLRKKGIQKAWIANRTFESAAKLAKKFDMFPIYLDQFKEVLPQADVVFTATGTQGYLIDRPMVEKSLEDRRQKPQLFVDISVPRNIDPSVDEVSNAYLYNIDELQMMVEENQNVRQEASKKAIEIIDVETQQFLRELRQKNLSPSIQKLQQKVSTLLDQEWKKSFGSISEKDDRFLRSIQEKLIASPIHYLKTEDGKSSEEKLSLIEKIFDLDSEES